MWWTRKRCLCAAAIAAFVIVLVTAIVLAVVFAPGRHKLAVPLATRFPIDVVCLWADGSDAQWLASASSWFAKESAAHPKCGLVHSPLREPERVGARARDELFYSFATVAKFMPWVRKYILVTARPHVPWWWPPSGKVGAIEMVLVHHDAIFEDATRLPTFNSGAIQSHLSNIPDLAEHFILFDDDMFVGRPLLPSHFFTEDGATAVVNTYTLNPAQMPNGNWKRVCMNMVQLGKLFTAGDVHVPDHVPCPLFKSVFRQVTHGALRNRATRLHRFRGDADFAVQYMVTCAMVARGLTKPVPPELVSRFLGVYDTLRTETFPSLPPYMFCLNDRMTRSDVAYLEKLVNS